MAGAVDCPHASLADQFEDLVFTDACSDKWILAFHYPSFPQVSLDGNSITDTLKSRIFTSARPGTHRDIMLLRSPPAGGRHPGSWEA